MNAQAFSLTADGDAEWVTEDVPSLLGRPARSFGQFAADYAAAFPEPRYRRSGRSQALALIVHFAGSWHTKQCSTTWTPGMECSVRKIPASSPAVGKGQQAPWIVPDELWARIEPLLPVVPQRAGHLAEREEIALGWRRSCRTGRSPGGWAVRRRR